MLRSLLEKWHEYRIALEERRECPRPLAGLEIVEECRRCLERARDVLRGFFEVALNPVRDAADPHSLIPVPRGTRQTLGAGRQLKGVAMPLKHLQISREPTEDGIAPRRLCQEHVAEPELRSRPEVHLGAESGRK